MNALVKKEIRLLLPAWIIALLGTVLLAVLKGRNNSDHSWDEFVFVVFGFGALLLGLAPFGQELSNGTFSILLAQPVSRLRLWRMKAGLLLVALTSLFITCLVCVIIWGPLPDVPDWASGVHVNPHFYFARNLAWLIVYLLRTIGLCVVVVCATALWTTLLLRQIGAAFWFTILVPSFVGGFSYWAFEKYWEAHVVAATSGVLLVYSVAGYLFARRMFLRAQDTAWTGGEISLPAWLNFRAPTATRTVAHTLNPLRALIRKEFQSHHITLLISAALFVSHLVGIAVRKLEYDPTKPHKAVLAVYQILGFWWLLWFAVPMVIGGTVVAEERKLGTLEGQLCLPVKRGWQFTVKLGMALLLGVFLGGVMPGLCEGIANWVGVPGQFPAASNPKFWNILYICCLIATGIVLLSVFASTLTRNLLQALGTAVLTGMGLFAFGELVVQQEHVAAPLWMGPLGIYIGLPVMVAAVMGLAYKNFKSLQVGLKLWMRNVFVVLGAMILIVTATTLIWNRVWELAMTLEPAHGPAQLTGPVRPSINIAGNGEIFALLPDGRIWAGDKFEVRETGQWESVRENGEEHLKKIQVRVPVGGGFVAGSNWTQLASSHLNVVGIRADGSLWNLFQMDAYQDAAHFRASISNAPQPERIGSDSDWQTVVSGAGGFAALKRDGSLWTWKRADKKPIRLGSYSDWTSVFGSSQTFAGIKRDGSVWKWGYLDFGPTGYQNHNNWKREQPEPIPWYPAGGDWVAMAIQNSFDVLIKRDGTAWLGGAGWGRFLGEAEQNYGAIQSDMTQVTRVGTKADWADIKSNWHSLIALRKNGMIYHNGFQYGHLALWGSMWELSRHSDWIAVENYPWNNGDLSLAADGTLAAWGDPMSGSHGLLGPSRAPLWTLNIFAGAK